jgi:hypothetical protein
MASWVHDYLIYTQRQESPDIFHTWTAITTVAATLGRKVWLERRSGGITRYRIYPGQLVVLFVAGSGEVRKTTAINPSKKFLRHINRRIISGKNSPEAFLDQLDPKKNGTPQAILIESEITVFLSKQTYTEPLIDIILDLADAGDEFVFNTRKGGFIVIPEPCLTILAATTPESLGERMPSSASGAGFTARMIVVYAKETNREESLTDVEDTDVCVCGRKDCNYCRGDIRGELAINREAQQRLLSGIEDLDKTVGPFTYSTDGKIWMDNFYHHWRAQHRTKGEGYLQRRPDHMLRVAMVIVASRYGNPKLEIDEAALRAADNLLTLTEKSFDKAFAFVGTQYAKDRQRIIEFITSRAGKCSTAEITAAMYAYYPNNEVLLRTLRLLAAAGVLKHSFSSTHPFVESWELVGGVFNP